MVRYGVCMSPVELLEKATNRPQILPADLVDDEDELLIEEISIDGMCGVY